VKIMRRALFAVSWIPVLALSCSTCHPPPDPDGVATGSQPLELGSWKRDALDCAEGDCADWYRFETSEPGTLRVAAVRVEDGRELPEFSLALADGDGRVLEEGKSGGQTRVRFAHPKAKGQFAPPGRFTLAVQTPPEDEGALGYELRVTFTAKPVPKPAAPREAPPRFRNVDAKLLEVETRSDGGEAVLLDQGSRSGLAPGQRGRLLVGGKKLADIEILDVYPDGSRALIRGSLGAAITPNTVAEIDVPL
jgi:hypothetical protein